VPIPFLARVKRYEALHELGLIFFRRRDVIGVGDPHDGATDQFLPGEAELRAKFCVGRDQRAFEVRLRDTHGRVIVRRAQTFLTAAQRSLGLFAMGDIQGLTAYSDNFTGRAKTWTGSKDPSEFRSPTDHRRYGKAKTEPSLLPANLANKIDHPGSEPRMSGLGERKGWPTEHTEHTEDGDGEPSHFARESDE